MPIFAHMDKTRKHELTVYLILWALLFLSPAVAFLIQTVLAKESGEWTMILQAWQHFLPYLVLFWLHDIFVAPQILRRNNRKKFAMRFAVLLLLFMSAILIMEPKRGQRQARQEPHMERPLPQDMEAQPQPREPIPPYGMPHDDVTPPKSEPIRLEVWLKILMGCMVCGANIGIKLFFKSLRDEAESKERERQNLQKELEMLTYQISPHFFMNTLNNIHALIDIDPEKAKTTVIELSRMMRYVLYESDASGVSVNKEIDFLNHYLAIMRLRYIDKVKINTDFSTVEEQAVMPPLLLVTFVENAFKHGISYRSRSFINISVSSENGLLTFKCQNSVPEQQRNGKPGIGLENVKKRLQLTYGDDYTLKITNSGETFCVLLQIPTSYDKMYRNG